MKQQIDYSKKPIFVVGVGRSGTTLIRLMLHSHPSIAIPYETHFITKYASEIGRYGNLNLDRNLVHLAEDILNENLLQQWDHEFDMQRVLKSVSERSLGGVIDAVYSEYCRAKGKRRWGDKSDYLGQMFVINKLFPDCQFIHCIRDGRDVANSVMKLAWGPKDLIQAAEWWSSSIKLGRSMGAMLPANRYTEVRYEDLVTAPEPELRRVCEFLEEDYSQSMLEYYKSSDKAIPTSRKGQHYNVGSPPNASRACAWKSEMSNVDVALFEKYAGKQLESMGYDTNAATAGRLRMEMRRGSIFIRRLLAG